MRRLVIVLAGLLGRLIGLSLRLLVIGLLGLGSRLMRCRLGMLFSRLVGNLRLGRMRRLVVGLMMRRGRDVVMARASVVDHIDFVGRDDTADQRNRHRTRNKGRNQTHRVSFGDGTEIRTDLHLHPACHKYEEAAIIRVMTFLPVFARLYLTEKAERHQPSRLGDIIQRRSAQNISTLGASFELSSGAAREIQRKTSFAL